MPRPALWSVMGNWVGKPEWMICSVKLAFTAEEHVLWMDSQCGLPETFIWEEREGEGCLGGLGDKWEVPKMPFIGMITRSWYTEQALGLGHERVLGLGLLQFAQHCAEQDRNFIWNDGMFNQEVAMEKHVPWQPMAVIQRANGGAMSKLSAFHTASTAKQPYSVTNYAIFFPFGYRYFCFPKLSLDFGLVKKEIIAYENICTPYMYIYR